MSNRKFSDEFKAKATDQQQMPAASPTASDLESAQRQIRELQAQLAEAKRERDILRKSTAEFLKELKQRSRK